MTEDELKQQLTAAEEQVAEMREALAEYGNHKTWCELEDDALKTGPRVDTICTCNFDKAFSAAPKRGRVLWEGRGYTYWSVTMEKLMVSLPTGSFDIDDKEIPQREVAVTVREAE